MWNIEAKIIKTGTITIDPGCRPWNIYFEKKHQMGIGGGSTVTLIKEEDDLILVDTGFDYESDFSENNKLNNWIRLKTLLNLNGISHLNITKVLITHLHRDHFENIEKFKNAKWYCHKEELSNFENPLKEKFNTIDDGEFISLNTRVIQTPGHTKGHCSILWTDENESIRVAISGDAIINLAYLQSGILWKHNPNFYDEDKANNSIKFLLENSDIIIPGHGQPFFTSILKNK